MTNESDTNRPYAPSSNVVSVLQRLRSRNLPETVDLDYLRDAGIPDGTVHRTLFAMRFLGLVEEGGGPTQALRTIHTSTDEEYRETLAGLIREAYSEVFNVIDPAEDSQERIANVFRRYTPASQRNRMVIFFLGMCRDAGIATLDVPRERSMAQPRTPRPAPAHRPRPTAQPKAEQGTAKAASAIDPALEGLVASLPSPGTQLSKARREQWIKMARATLDFVYPEETEMAAAATADSEEETDES